jgi:hypothetical protein
MKLQEQIEVVEDAHEFVGDDKTVRVWSDYPMEKQILETYTHPIYNWFQVELQKITSYNARDCGGGVLKYFQCRAMFLVVAEDPIWLMWILRMKFITASAASLKKMVFFAAIFSR